MTAKLSESRLARLRLYNAGISFRLVRSPAAPKMTMMQGGLVWIAVSTLESFSIYHSRIQIGSATNCCLKFLLNQSTAKRFATQSPGLPLRPPWVRKSIIHNRNAVASAGRNPYRVDYLEPLFPRVETTLGSETLPLRGMGIRAVALQT